MPDDPQWAATIRRNRAVIPAHHEAAANSKDVLECISTIRAKLEHSAVETKVRIDVGRFEVEVVPEC